MNNHHGFRKKANLDYFIIQVFCISIFDVDENLELIPIKKLMPNEKTTTKK